MEERNRSLYEKKLQEVRTRTAEETRAYYLQCLHHLVNSKGEGSCDLAQESHDTGGPEAAGVAKSVSRHLTKTDGTKKRTVLSSSPKQVKPVSRVTSFLPDGELGILKKSSSKKQVVSHRVVAGKPCQVSSSKFVPKTKLILHSECKSVSPQGVYWSKEREGIGGRVLDHQVK